MYISNHPHLCSFIYTTCTLKLKSQDPYCTQGEFKYFRRSLQCCTRYMVSQNRKHFDWWDSGMFIVWGTGAGWCALSFPRHFEINDGVCAALFIFIYSAVRMGLKTALVKWGLLCILDSPLLHYVPHTTRTTHGTYWNTSFGTMCSVMGGEQWGEAVF